jgi:hypothetical protein
MGLLKNKYQLPILDFRDRFIEFVRKEKQLRRLTRKLVKGYQNKEPEEGEEEAEPVPDEEDPEIMEEHESFEPE